MDAMTTRKATKFILLFAVVAFLLLLPILVAEATNDVNAASQSNGTMVELTATWTEYANISNFATGSGNTTITISINAVVNYSTATIFGRIKRNGTVLETFNLTKSTYPETVTFVAPVGETIGTHNYTFEAYSTSGRKGIFYNRTFSVIYLNTGSFGAGGGGGNVSGVIGSPTGVLDCTGTDIVTCTISPLGTNFRNDTISTHTSQIGTLQSNDTSDRSYVNVTFLPISTYNGNFPNTSLPNYLLISTYNGNYPNTSLTNYLLINTYAGNFPNSSLGNYLLISTYNGDYPNSTLVNYVPFSNTSYLRNTTFFCGTNTTCTYNANGSISIASTGGTGGGVTMNEVNASGQFQSSGQVTGLNGSLNVKWNKTDNIPESNLTLNYPTHSQEHDINGTDHTGLLDYVRLKNVLVNIVNNITGILPLGNLPTIPDSKLENGSFFTKNGTTLAEVNASAEIPRNHVTGQIAVDDAQNTSITNIESVNVNQNTSISALQVNDTYFNGTVFPNSTNFRNDSAVQTSTYNANFPNTSLPNYLLINTYNSDFPNSTLSGYGNNFPNSTVGTKEASWDAKEPAISQGVSPQFWMFNKTWQNITTTWVTEGVNLWFTNARAVTAVQSILDAMNQSSASNNTASQNRDDLINSTKANKTDIGEFTGGTIGSGRYGTGIVRANISDYGIVNVSAGNNVTITWSGCPSACVAQINSAGGVTMDEVNASAQITRAQVTGQIAVDDAQNISITNIETVNINQNNSISDIQTINVNQNNSIANIESVNIEQNSSISTKTTLTQVNTSALLDSIAQVAGLQGLFNFLNNTNINQDTNLTNTRIYLNSSNGKLNKTDLNSTVDKNLSNYSNTPNFVTNSTMDRNLTNGTGTIPSGSLSTNQRMTTLAMVFDGAGSVLTAQNHNTSIGYSGVIQDIILTGDVIGSATVIISNASSTSNTTYTSRCTITMTNMQDKDDTTLSGCATSLAAKDRINFNLSSVSTLSKLSVALNILKD